MRLILLYLAFAPTDPAPAAHPSPPAEPPKITRSTEGPVIPADAPESFFVETLKLLREQQSQRPESLNSSLNPNIRRSDLLPLLDEFLRRFPNSEFRPEAIRLKLSTLAQYGRVHPQFALDLLSFHEEVKKEYAAGPLAADADFYAIQGFVLAARAENMPDDRRLMGTIERYEAFLSDHPTSEHRPVVRASLIRNYIALKQLDRATAELDKLRKESPDHPAAKRAAGEVYQAASLGKPFGFIYSIPDGRTLDTTQYTGRVLLLHFWASWSDESILDLPRLRDLHAAYHDAGLQIIGINVDRERRAMNRITEMYTMPWPHFYDDQGLENEALVGVGVIHLPTYFLIDRRGVLRRVTGDVDFIDLIKELLAEPDSRGG